MKRSKSNSGNCDDTKFPLLMECASSFSSNNNTATTLELSSDDDDDDGTKANINTLHQLSCNVKKFKIESTNEQAVEVITIEDNSDNDDDVQMIPMKPRTTIPNKTPKDKINNNMKCIMISLSDDENDDTKITIKCDISGASSPIPSCIKPKAKKEEDFESKIEISNITPPKIVEIPDVIDIPVSAPTLRQNRPINVRIHPTCLPNPNAIPIDPNGGNLRAIFVSVFPIQI